MATRVPQREVREDKARHAAVLDDVEGGSDDDGRDTVGFEVSGDQTHGLVADRSKRGQDGGVDAILLQSPQDLRRIPFRRLLLAVIGWRGVEVWCETTQRSVGDQPPRRIDGQEGLAVVGVR